MTRKALASLRAGLLAALACAPALRASGPVLPSKWTAAEVRVDGDDADWSGRLVPVPDVPISVGVRNDGSFLYLCVRTSDEATRQKIRELGLSVWLDASGKADRAFGIRYPAGLRDGGDADLPDSGDLAFQKSLEDAVAGGELRLLGKRDGNTPPVKVAEARPIEAALGEHDGVLVVELKVPLAFGVDTPHAIEATPGSTIALGLETTEPRGTRAGGGRGRSGFRMGGFGGGGRGGRGGRGGGGGGAADGGERESKNREKVYGKPLKAWLTVPLAPGPDAPSAPTPAR